MELEQIVNLLNGGTPAIAVLIYFIWKLEARLARIEKALDKFLTQEKLQ